MMTRQQLGKTVIALALLVVAGAVVAQPAPPGPKIGVVDLARLVSGSPQASRAKSNMAKKFAGRKKKIEARTKGLGKDMDRLQQDGPVMSDGARDKLQTSIRNRQRELQMQQSKYNDDVNAAEQAELERLRADIRAVIDQYAADHDYDLILGDSVLYATDAVDVTDEVLAQLKDRQ